MAQEETKEAVIERMLEQALAGRPQRPGDAELATMREQIRAFVEDPKAREKMENAKMMSAAVGLPMVQDVFNSLVGIGNGSQEEKDALLADIEALIPPGERGSLKLVYGVGGGQTKEVYLVLGECELGYDLGKTIADLCRETGEEKRPELLRHITSLINIGRSAYVTVTSQRRELLERMAAHIPGASAVDLRELTVDMATSLMYAHPDCPKRICVVVKDAPAAPVPKQKKGKKHHS